MTAGEIMAGWDTFDKIFWGLVAFVSVGTLVAFMCLMIGISKMGDERGDM